MERGAAREGIACSLEANDFFGASADNMYIDDYKVVQLRAPVGLKSKGNNPIDFYLSQNYPNPFNPSTNITFNLSETGQIKLVVYNALGQEIATLVNDAVRAGQHLFKFNTNSLPSVLLLK